MKTAPGVPVAGGGFMPAYTAESVRLVAGRTGLAEAEARVLVGQLQGLAGAVARAHARCREALDGDDLEYQQGLVDKWMASARLFAERHCLELVWALGDGDRPLSVVIDGLPRRL